MADGVPQAVALGTIGTLPSSPIREDYIKSVRPPRRPHYPLWLYSTGSVLRRACRRICIQGHHSSQPDVRGHPGEELRGGPIAEEGSGWSPLRMVNIE